MERNEGSGSRPQDRDPDRGRRESQHYADQGSGWFGDDAQPAGRNESRELSSDRRGQFDDPRRGGPGAGRGGSGGQASFMQGGHDQTGNWQGATQDQGQRSEHYERSGYGERRDEHGTAGSRDRHREYQHQGGTSITGGETGHWGEGGYGQQRTEGQWSQPGYGSGQYGRQGYGSSEYGGRGGEPGGRSGGSGVYGGGAGYGPPDGPGSRERQEHSGQGGAWGGRHQGQEFGRNDERDYRSQQYAGGHGYASEYGQGGAYGGGIHRRDAVPGQQGQVRAGQQYGYGGSQSAYDPSSYGAGDQGRSEYGQQRTDYGSGPSYGGSSDWGRRHEYGVQGGYGGRHWGEGQYREDSNRQGRHRDERHEGQHGVGNPFGSGSSQYGQGAGTHGGYFNPGGFGSGLSSGGTAGLGGGDRTFRDGGMAGDVRQGSGIGGSGYYGQGGSFGYGGGRTGGESGAALERGGQGGYGMGSGMGGIAAGGYGAQGSQPNQWGSQQQQAQPRRRGPKNYQRSDERLRELISDRLLEDPHIDSSDVSVEVKSGEVALTGTVDDRRTKYQIEELVEQIHGVRDVDNRLKVRRGFLASLFGGGDESSGRGERESMHYGAATDQREGSQGGAHQYGTSSSSAQRPILGPSDTLETREQREHGDPGAQNAGTGIQTSGSGTQTSATPTTSTKSITGSTLSGGAAAGGGTGAERSEGERAWNDRPATERNVGERSNGGGTGAASASAPGSGAGSTSGGAGSTPGTGSTTAGGTTSASGVSNEPKSPGERGGRNKSS